MEKDQGPLRIDAMVMQAVMQGWNGRPFDAKSGQKQGQDGNQGPVVETGRVGETEKPIPGTGTGTIDDFRRPVVVVGIGGQSMAEAIQAERDFKNRDSIA